MKGISRLFVGIATFAVLWLAGCGGGGGGEGSGTGEGATVISCTPSRTSGVSPLAVIFDASGTRLPSLTSRPFHEVEYRWNFGDAGSGSWANGTGINNLRNEATGPIAAHVFEPAAGAQTYSVTLTITNGSQTINVPCGTIVVSDPDVVFSGANTVCVSTGVDFTGCPAGALLITDPDFDNAVNTNIGTNKRILFRRGDTFVADAEADVRVPGPGIIGAYGAGAKPIVQLGGTENRIFRLSHQTTPNTSDWRIMDLELDGMSVSDSRGFTTLGSVSNMLFQRLNIHHMSFGFSIGPDILDANNATPPFHPMYQGMFFVDNSITNAVDRIVAGVPVGGPNACFCAGEGFAFLGNFVDNNSNIEHGLRSEHMVRGVVSHNTIQGIGTTFGHKANLALRAQPFAGTVTVGPNPFSEKIVISDNKFIGGASQLIVRIEPTSSSQDERVRDVIFERNWVIAGPGTAEAIFIEATQLTFRNNIIDMTSSTDGVRALMLGNDAPAPGSSDIWVYHNSFFKGDTLSGGLVFRPIVMDAGASNITIQNNLGWAPDPGAGSAVMITDQGAVPLTVTTCSLCNTINAEITVTDPLYSDLGADNNLAAITEWQLQAPSYGVDRGIAVPVISDLFRQTRPLGAAPSLGAHER